MAETQINVGMNVDGVVAGTEKAKRKLSELGGAARTAGADAGQGMASMGNGADAAAKKVEAATRNMIGSIQRQTAAIEAGDRSSRAYQESLAKLRGVDVDVLKPYLDYLDSVKAKQLEAAESAETLARSLTIVEMVTAGVVASAGAIAAFSKSILDTADNLNDLSQSVGISIEQLAKYQLASEQSGASLDVIGKSVKELAKNLLDNGDALRKAGIDATNADGAFMQLSELFAEMPDGIEKTTLATKLFGKAGIDLIPTLNLGAEGLQAAATASAGFAKQMEIMAPLADELNDGIAELGLNSKTAGAVMVNEFLPTLNAISAAFLESTENADSFANVLGTTIKVTLQTVAVLVSDVAYVLKGLGREMGGIVAQFSALGEGGGIFFAEGRRAWSNVGEAIKEDGENAKKSLDKWQSDLINGVARADKNVQSAYNSRQGFNYVSKTRGSSLLDSLGSPDKLSAAKSAKAAADEYQKLDDEMNKHASSMRAEIDSKGALSEADKYRETTLAKLITAYQNGKISMAEYIELESKMTDTEGLVAQAEAHKNLGKAISEALASAKKATDEESARITGLRAAEKAVTDYEKSTQDAADALEYETGLVGLNVDERKRLIDVYKVEAELKKKIAEIEVDTRYAGDETGAREAAIAAVRIASAQAANTKISRDAIDKWTKTNDEIGSKLADAILSGGSEGVDDLGKYLVQKLFLEPIKIKLIAELQPITGAITNAILGNLGGGAAGSAGNASGAGWMTDFGGNASGSISNFGSKIGGEFGADLMMNAETYGGYAKMAGDAFGYITAAYDIANGKIGKGLGTAVGTYFGGPVGGAIGGTLGSMLDGPGYTSSSTLGAAQSTIGANGSILNSVSVDANQSAAMLASAKTKAETLAQSYFKTASELGIKAIEASFLYNSNTGREGANPNAEFRVTAGGASFGSGEITASDTAAVNLAASRAIFTALQASELPGYLAKVFNSITASSASQEQIDAAMAYASSLKTIRAALLETREPLDILKTQLSDGLASLGTSAANFKTDFVAAIDQGINAESLAKWQALGATLEQVNAAAATLAKTNQGWQDQLDILIGKETKRSQTLRDTSDASTKSLMLQVWAQEDLTSAQEAYTTAQVNALQAVQAAQDEYNNSLSDAQSFLSGALKNVSGYIDKLNATDQGLLSPQDQLANAASQFSEQLAKVNAGDRDALSGITGYADQYINAQTAYSGSGGNTVEVIASIKSALAMLPDQLSAEQFIVNAIKDTTQSVKDLKSKLVAELTVTARSEIAKLIEFIADTDKLPNDLKALALATSSTLSKTVDYIVGSQLPDDLKQIALTTTSTLTKNASFVVVSDMSAESKRLALMGTESVAKTIALASQMLLSPVDQRLALMGSEAITKTIVAASGANDPTALGIAFAQASTIEKMIQASGGVLTSDQRSLLDGVTQYNKNITITAYLDPTGLNAMQQLLQTSFGTIDLSAIGNRTGAGGATLTGLIGQAERDKLASINAYVNTLDWSPANKAASAATLLDTAAQYGVTSTQIATATGYSQASINDLLYEGARLNSIEAYVNTLSWGNPAADAASIPMLAATAAQYGVTQADIAASMGFSVTDIQAMFAAQGIGSFAAGGMHSGGLRLVGENGPELEVTGPSRIYNAADTMAMLRNPQQNSEALAAEIRELRKEVAELRKSNTSTRQDADIKVTIVTPDGKKVAEQTISQIKERSRRGELVIYAEGVK